MLPLSPPTGGAPGHDQHARGGGDEGAPGRARPLARGARLGPPGAGDGRGIRSARKAAMKLLGA